MSKKIKLDRAYDQNSILFIKSTHYDDIFDYKICNDELTIYRIGIIDPYNIRDDYFHTIDIGTCENYTKCIKLTKKYASNAILKIEDHIWPDKFIFNIYNDILVVKRTDKKEGWNYFHRLKIYEGWDNDLVGYISENNNNLNYNIGLNDCSEKRIQLNEFYPEGCVHCTVSHPFTDRFIIKFLNNNIIINRYDRNEGWMYQHNIFFKRRYIPKTILQTHHSDLPENVLNHLSKKAYGWKYNFYKDDDILLFFETNPIPEFPNIINLFNSINIGQHKADLFRYYYLYLKGGVFLDSDAMIYKNLDDIICSYNFVTVVCRDESLYFNGFIATEPYNIIMYDSLKEIYNYNINELNGDYFKIVRDFKRISDNHLHKFNYKLYYEKGDWVGYMPTVDVENNNELIFTHYYGSKCVPDNIM
jgi:hypothetical protein